MATGFILAPASKVRSGDYPEFKQTLQDLELAAVQRAQQMWTGFSFGGLRPNDKQFGMTTIRPRDIFGGGTATWSKRFGSQGSWGNIWSYSVPEDEIHAIAGVLIPDPTLIFAQLRLEIGDRRLAIMDIEEAHAFSGGFGLVFKQDKNKPLIAEEEERVLLRGFQERGTAGRTQRVIPLGFQLYRNKDLHIVEREVSN